MISIKHYLEETQTESGDHDEPGAQQDAEAQPLLSVTVAAYRSSLVEMGNCGRDACPALGGELKQGLGKVYREKATSRKSKNDRAESTAAA
ncbi:MAG TPA: hypothetical protein VGE85_16370 [Terracidiphilus sp.]|jgi:hypothetical protein